MAWWQVVVDYFMSELLSKNVSCGSKKTTMAQTEWQVSGTQNQTWELPNVLEVSIITPATFKCYIQHSLNY